MFEYKLSVSMADSTISINDTTIKKLLIEAIQRVNCTRNSRLKGRVFKLTPEPIDDNHVQITLTSNTEVIPTRALSSLARAILDVDTDNILTSYRGCIFNSSVIANQENILSSMSDVEMMQELQSMVFGQLNMNNRDKQLSREYTEKIRILVIEYINAKSRHQKF